MYWYTETLITKYSNRYVHFRSVNPSSSGHYQGQKDKDYGPSKQLLSTGNKNCHFLCQFLAFHMRQWYDNHNILFCVSKCQKQP